MRFAILSAVLWASTPATFAADAYTLPPEATLKADVPKGTITAHKWESKVFDGTSRDYWVYVPAQYKAETPACVMIFQDGSGYQNPTGGYRTPIVFDNLIHAGEMPVTVGIFINPGTFKDKRSNRSFEYDTPSPQYATFLEKEILPEVEKTVKLRHDAASRAVCGISSGGICAFTAAWERPDLFSKVLSHVGSFTNIRHGDVYPGLIRKTERKPIRFFLQDGSNDLDNLHGHWPLANVSMTAALRYKDYDYKFVYGDGGHNSKHGAALLPDSLRWLWRDWKKEAK
ncbi:alpha/beta hydrolase [Limnoglobus roseus]|uniref:Putative alpha/beta-hydrolase-type carbohydrate esterase n=1 Tax=Limnoglobus roseus TaxID=2598579 RepID=A0A5C1ABC6_9BACT|nr:alpha/beta hydrolase-fold protein [Limnoglobus roseus]QEL15527.1 putative alpha/beta-hydrolase-type carbohydrate esterase [Limnoglobus roseus]